MKKIVLAMVSATIIALCALPLFGCNGNEMLSGTFTVVCADKDAATVKTYAVDLSVYDAETSVEDVLYDLSNDEGSDFYYVGKHSTYGLYLTEVGYAQSVKTEYGDSPVYTPLAHEDMAAGSYVFVYTDITDSFSTDWGSVTYEGKTLGSASYGVSGLAPEDGKIVYLTQGSYN